MKTPKTQNAKRDAKDQHSEFVKAAREIGTDESEDAFDKVLRKVASAPPPKTVQQRKVKVARSKAKSRKKR